MADQQLQCRDCGGSFTFTDGEQEFYNSRGLSAPQRCKDCRQKRKNDRLSTRQMFPATCAKCGSACEVPFKPRPVEEGGKPVLCKDCFFKEKDASGGGSFRPPRAPHAPQPRDWESEPSTAA